MISCFWEGQEGSFLLWIFWHMILGWFLIRSKSHLTPPALFVFALVQAFLTSMILGVVLPVLDIKIGSSPFILLRDAMANAPVFQINPEYLPEDGRGLNPLLQNYWMVIHPPVVFLGFALTLVPFSYAIAALWKNEFTEWLKPALLWSLVGSCVLGVGIVMGAYWAYETLNFGGYWNWDPVENAVYIPWLFLVAAVHTLLIARKKAGSIKTTFILVICCFLLVLYATFLTRSGILGNASVHSFTDLGLSGQLMVYMLTFVFLAISLLVARWKNIPSSTYELNTYVPEFWVFTGVTILGLAAFQVLSSTSIPVANAIIENLGFESKMAPPANPLTHYTVWQLWFSVAIAIFSAIGQYFWWKGGKDNAAWKSLNMPLVSALAASTGIIILANIQDISYIILLTASIFSLTANGSLFVKLMRKNFITSGGALAHSGIAIMLIGILFSSGYSNVISKNTSGLIYRKDFNEEMNRDNVLLWRNTDTKMGDFSLRYAGPRLELQHAPGYYDKASFISTDDPYKAIAKTNLSWQGKQYHKQGDTVSIYPENTYYEIQFESEKHKSFTLYPRAQVNPSMGLISSPDISKLAKADLYTHVSSIPSPDEEVTWTKPEKHALKIGDTLFLNDMVAIFEGVDKIPETEQKVYGKFDAAISARIKVLDKNEIFWLKPIFLINQQMVARIPDINEGIGMHATLVSLHPETGTFDFETKSTQKDWVILKVMEKPWINLLWGGSILMTFGFIIAIRRKLKHTEI